MEPTIDYEVSFAPGDWEQYCEMVLRAIRSLGPACSEPQLWQGVAGQLMDLKYPTALYLAIESLEESNLLTRRFYHETPHRIFRLTDPGIRWLESRP